MVSIIQKCAKDVFKEMGSGHSEAVYEACLALEITETFGETVTRQVPCVLEYKGYSVGVGYIDLLINNWLPVEIKTVAKLTPKDEQQVRKYLEAIDKDYGLLINFGTTLEFVEVERLDHGKTLSTED